MTALPSLFLSHGAPDLPLHDLPARRFLAGLAQRLPAPRAILAVSAHWEADAHTVGSAPAPDTVHDFGGFPDALYRMRYPARTDAGVIDRVTGLLAAAGHPVANHATRGYDHGVWVPLMLAFPKADIPIVQLSLRRGAGPAEHFAAGQALAPLRDEGVLVIGSGAATHNLRAMAPEGTPPPDWALSFDAWLLDRVTAQDRDALVTLDGITDIAAIAHPSPEHLLPFFVAMGAGWDDGAARRLHHSYTYGSISMAAFAFGTTAKTIRAP